MKLAKRDGAANLTAETQVLRDRKVVLTGARKVDSQSADPKRIPYGADLDLNSLTPGAYELRVKIADAVAGTTTSQTTDFVVR